MARDQIISRSHSNDIAMMEIVFVKSALRSLSNLVAKPPELFTYIAVFAMIVHVCIDLSK